MMASRVTPVAEEGTEVEGAKEEDGTTEAIGLSVSTCATSVKAGPCSAGQN